VPDAVVVVTVLIVGAVVSMAILLLADKLATGVKLETAFPAASRIVPLISVVSSALVVSVAKIVYVQLPVSDPVTVMVQVLGVGVVFKDTVISPVDVTTSEKVRVMLTVELTV